MELLNCSAPIRHEGLNVMSFEERKERLAERHEALAQSVEMHNAMLSRIEALQNHQREMLEGVLVAPDRLVQVAGRHEERISKLERS